VLCVQSREEAGRGNGRRKEEKKRRERERKTYVGYRRFPISFSSISRAPFPLPLLLFSPDPIRIRPLWDSYAEIFISPDFTESSVFASRS